MGAIRASRLRPALLVLGALYLCGVWLEGIGASIPNPVVLQPALYFLQVAALFTSAATVPVDYRAEAWLCEERRWVEMDTRPYFAIDRDNKENRFHRALHFYKRNRATLQTLERYLLESHMRGHAEDGVPPRARVGGIRFLSVRRPIPAAGEPATRWRRAPLAEYSKDERRLLYWTPPSKRQARCGGSIPVREEGE
jgi:hypothetical protein